MKKEGLDVKFGLVKPRCEDSAPALRHEASNHGFSAVLTVTNYEAGCCIEAGLPPHVARAYQASSSISPGLPASMCMSYSCLPGLLPCWHSAN